MKACRACGLFVRVAELQCPFCGATQTCAPVRSWALGCTLGLAACGPAVAPDDGAVDSSSGTPSTSVTTVASTTTAPTTTDASSTSTTDDDVTSATSSGDSSSSSASSASEAAYGIADPDGSDEPDCDLWAQDCPRGSKCMPFATADGNTWDSVRCTPLDPTPAAIGDPCTVEGSPTSGFDDCELGAMCWHVDPDTNAGTCVGLCDGTPDAPSCETPGTVCAIANEGVLPLCLTSCDPMMPLCPEGEQCSILDEQQVCVPS